MDKLTLITGATGFLGAEIVRQFEVNGTAVCTTGRRPAPDLPAYRPHDLVRNQDVAALLHRVDRVVHVAGLAHNNGARKSDRHRFFEVNVAGTEALAKAAARAGVGHFVFISSMSVYGSRCPANADETSACQPAGPYAESKWEAERRLMALAQRYGFWLTILRLATLYGEGDPGNVARLMRAIDRQRFVWVGRGENLKTLMHREDAARAVALAADRQGGAPIDVFNIAGAPVCVRDVVEILAFELGKKVPRFVIPGTAIRLLLTVGASAWPLRAKAKRFLSTLDKWLGDDVMDGSKFAREFGFHPRVGLAEGLSREVDWYRGEDGETAGHSATFGNERSARDTSGFIH